MTLYRALKTWLFGAKEIDGRGQPIPLYMRQLATKPLAPYMRSAPVEPARKLRACDCGRLHDHPTRRNCIECEVDRPRAKVAKFQPTRRRVI